MAARSLTFWLPVAKWLCHISESRSPSGSGPSSMRKIHHALRRSGRPVATAASAIAAEARSNSAAAPAGSIRPARSRSTLASGPSSRSRLQLLAGRGESRPAVEVDDAAEVPGRFGRRPVRGPEAPAGLLSG